MRPAQRAGRTGAAASHSGGDRIGSTCDARGVPHRGRAGWAGARCSADTRPPQCGGWVCARGLVAQLFAKLRVSRNSCLQLFVKRPV